MRGPCLHESVLSLAALALAPACAATGEPYRAGDGERLLVETGEFMVGAGDVFECFYTGVITDRELAVTGTFGTQGAGGHHITVYYTEQVKPVEHHPCVDAEMATWRMVGGGGAGESMEASGKLKLTDGLAIRVPAGVQIVLQAHYINVGEPFVSNDQATIELVRPDEVVDYVNQFLTIDVGFAVPPHEEVVRTTTCVVPEDVPIIRLLGHMHEWGTRYTLEEIDDRGERKRVLLDEEWKPLYSSNPPVRSFDMDEPLLLTAGTRLRQTCVWQNGELDELRFPREMCLAFGLYYPDRGAVTCQP